MLTDDLTNLYIFVTSDTPDVYINIIGYCITHYNIGRIVFLGIVKDKGQKAREQSKLATIKDRVRDQLSLLQQNEYLYMDQDTKKWQKKPIDINLYDKSRYARIAEREIDIHIIIYNTLEEELSVFLRAGNSLFDVSAVSKTFSIDVYTILRIKQVEDIFVFELKLPRRLYNEEELIHNLYLDNHDYEYTNVTKSFYTRGTIVKSEVQENLEVSKSMSTDKLIEELSSHFARNIMFLYAIIAVIAFTLAIIFVIRGGWNTLEPWTFIILAVLPYLVNVFAVAIFKKEVSLGPAILYHFLKDYRLKKLTSRLQRY